MDCQDTRADFSSYFIYISPEAFNARDPLDLFEYLSKYKIEIKEYELKNSIDKSERHYVDA